MVYLYNPTEIFNAFCDLEGVDLFDESKSYTKSDIIVCPIKWELWSIEALMIENYHEALKNKDFEHVCQGFRTKKIDKLIENYGAKILLYQEWECRDLMLHQSKLEKFVTEHLKMPIGSVYFSTCDYLRHMKPLFGNVISFDWVYVREKANFREDNIIAHHPKQTKRIITLNYRGSQERFAYCYYLHTLHRDKITFSYLDAPLHDLGDLADILGSSYEQKEFDVFKKQIPRLLDGTNPDQHQTHTIHDYLSDAAINVAFETNLESINSFAEQVSEKAYKGLRIGKPFMIFTTKGRILQHLRSLGFKTFSPLINEEYDNPKLSYEVRYRLLLDESSRICNMSEEEFQSLNARLQSIVQYNLDVLENGSTPNIFEWMSKPYRRKSWLSVVLKYRYAFRFIWNDRWSFAQSKAKIRKIVRPALG